MELDVDYLMENLTLEEKAGLCSGQGSWWTKAVDRLGIKSIMVSDGPNGLRQQGLDTDNLGINKSVEAVCFPTGSCTASAFSEQVQEALGDKLGLAARARNLHTILGPAINIKRSPLCGRNFEYYSEDPYLTGRLASSYINAVQKHNVGVSLKHFAANNQEKCRMSVDCIISERALREIYYRGFEMAVKNSHPWSMMCSYNRINGVFSSENGWLMNHILRKEWGFDGIVMTDWGAMNDRIKAIKAGVELEMPSSDGKRDQQLVDAVRDRRLKEKNLDEHVRLILKWIAKGVAYSEDFSSYDLEEQHQTARKLAADSAVLLKNQDSVLPLSAKTKVAFLGTYAKKPRFQGGGSSHLSAYRLTNALECAPCKVDYSPLWNEDGLSSTEDLEAQGLQAAKDADVAVVFAGLPDSYESEGFDRTSLSLPGIQDALIEKVAHVARKTVVVLHNGSPITMPWLDKVNGVLEMYLAGEAAGEATIDLLYGLVNPSGHLAETFPLRLEDTPCFGFFPGDGKKSIYNEDIYVGYRWYDTKKIDVLFPFGYGLSYSHFALSNIKVKGKGQGVEVTVDVTNDSAVAGKAVVQLYIRPPQARAYRPAHELKGFAKVELQPDSTQEVSLYLDKEDFAYYETSIEGWYVESGVYTIELGQDSRNIECSARINLKTPSLPLVVDDAMTIADVLNSDNKQALMGYDDKLFEAFGVNDEPTDHVLEGEAARAMCLELPVHSLPSFVDAPADISEIIIERLK